MSIHVRIITALELASLAPRPRIVDVREPEEFTGELGHIPGADLVPLATVTDAARNWNKAQAVLLVCRSGARSAKAAQSLVELGFENVINLEGGMRAYGQTGLPVERR